MTVAILIDRRPPNERQDAISPGIRIRCPFQDNDPTSLPTQETIGLRVKRLTASGGRDHTRFGEANRGGRREYDVHPTGQRQRCFATAQTLTGEMNRDEG